MRRGGLSKLILERDMECTLATMMKHSFKDSLTDPCHSKTEYFEWALISSFKVGKTEKETSAFQRSLVHYYTQSSSLDPWTLGHSVFS